MHRVNSKKRQKFILRIVSYSLLVVLTLVTTVLLLYAALGYRLSRDGSVVRSGLLLVDSRPVSADVILNGKDMNDPTDSRFVLPSGSYTLQLVREGYRKWSKQVLLGVSKVENIFYPLLVPDTLKTIETTKVNRPTMLSQSPDRKKALMVTRDGRSLELFKLGSARPEFKSIALPANFVRQNGSLGDLTAIEWSRNNERVLLSQRLSGGVNRLLSVDVEDPQDSIDVTSVLGLTPKDPHYQNKNASVLYGISGTTLRTYNLENGSSKDALARVRSYEPSGDEAFSFVAVSKDGSRLESGIVRDGEKTVVHKSAVSAGVGVTAYSEYDGNFYLAVQLPGENEVTLYRNPLKKPVLEEQLPYSKMKLKSVEKLEFGENSQLLLARSGRTLVVYDFEHDRINRSTVAKDTVAVNWLDSYHLLLSSKNNEVSMVDFDGANKYELTKPARGTLLFSDDLKLVYQLNKKDGAFTLQTLSMIVED